MGRLPPLDVDPTFARVHWDNNSDRIYEVGLDRGVLYPNDGPAVPWNGLTAIEESGSEGSAAYYIDGRPFLHLPKPKEFTATLSAVTYPDEFSSYMGLVEATDGMYLDSQQSDSFGLSYRTLIADPINGTAAGYKIHLVYNATVVPAAKSYSSLSDAINPVELSWDIQAVPLPVDGYRATAHITIDTRHMDSDKLQAIQDLIYGSEYNEARLPDPQLIFDTLHYGGAIIITDNGDGTWKAEGSYHNVYLIGDGVFQIDNVNAVHHGDGTYTISSTP